MDDVGIEPRHRELVLRIIWGDDVPHPSYSEWAAGTCPPAPGGSAFGEMCARLEHQARLLAIGEALGEAAGRKAERRDVVAECERVERLSGGDAAVAVRALLVTFQRGEHSRLRKGGAHG